MTDNNKVQRFDHGQLSAYQMGQQMASHLFSPTDNQTSATREMRIVQREGRIINGELYITEQEWEIIEEQGPPMRAGQAYRQPTPRSRSWIDILFGINS